MEDETQLEMIGWRKVVESTNTFRQFSKKRFQLFVLVFLLGLNLSYYCGKVLLMAAVTVLVALLNGKALKTDVQVVFYWALDALVLEQITTNYK